MRKDGVLNALAKDAPEEGATSNVINRINKMDEKAWAHIVFKLGEEPATLVTSLLMSGATTKSVWNKIQASYQKENIQSKLH